MDAQLQLSPLSETGQPATGEPSLLPVTVASRKREFRRIADSLRVVVAIMAIVMVLDTPLAQAATLVQATHLFAVYAGIMLWAGSRLHFSDHPLVCWVDAAWCLLLFYFAGGATPYFLLLFFPVLLTGLRVGIRDSVMLAIFSAIATVAVMGLLPDAPPWTRIMLMPLVLPVVGPMMAVLTRTEALIQEGVVLAGRLVSSLDPRTGIDVVASTSLRAMATTFGADSALLALRTPDKRTRVFCWEADETPSELTESASQAAAERIFSVSGQISAIYAAERAPKWLWRRRILARDQHGRLLSPSPSEVRTLASLAKLVGQANLLTIPVQHAGSLAARIVLARKERGFDEASMEVLGHMLERVVPVLQHAGLLEQLAAEAAETERARIGRDLHDSAIQPYIGLKFAVEALEQRCSQDNPILPYVRQLAAMTSEELASMRDVIAGLRSHRSSPDPLLAGAVRRQAERFGQLFGINVEVCIDGDMPVSRHLSGELFHMVSEGLSNIRRHTRSRQAWIVLSNDGDALTLCIRNRNLPGEAPLTPFTPHSIAERAASLGGSASVEASPEMTTITVCVPLPGARKQ